jgi:hypothetical protein
MGDYGQTNVSDANFVRQKCKKKIALKRVKRKSHGRRKRHFNTVTGKKEYHFVRRFPGFEI